MQTFRKILILFLIASFGLVLESCKDLTELNINPNGVSIEKANANLILSTVLTETAKQYTQLGYGDAAGVMQHTQKDAWFSGHNSYDWGPQDWGGHYNILRNNQAVYDKAVENDLAFHQGVSLVMKSFLFAQIADLWGDAPYTNALNGDVGGNENLLPSYDSQETIYSGVIADLKQAVQLLSQPVDSYKEILPKADVIYSGDPVKWRNFANSLLLRYLMRVSEKMDVQSDFVSIAQSGNIIQSNDENALMAYLGNTSSDAWPNNADIRFDGTNGSNFRRIRPAATLVEALRAKNDPRIGVWFEEVEVPTQLSETQPHNSIIEGVRYMNPDSVSLAAISTNPDYVGLPTQLALPSGFNYNPSPGQTSDNKFVSYLSDMYREASGPMLNARLMTYAEVSFLLAEAAQKGWLGDAATYYNEGVRASLDEWGVGDNAESYLAQENVAYDESLERIIEQKWIASWTAAQEAWFDYRRTALPDLQTGPYAPRSVLPIRFIYGSNELDFNQSNVSSAIEGLELTSYSQDEKNSPWSKTWLISGTGKPY